MPIFQKQSNRYQILHSLLVALSFTSSLRAEAVQSIVAGAISNKHFYVSRQKTRGYFKKRDELLILTTKAKKLIQSKSITLLGSLKGGGQISHTILLARSLFLLLLHLNLKDINVIKKQKQADSKYIPDLTIITQTETLFIEIDTGSETIKTLENKLLAFQSLGHGTLIYFTNHQKTYSYFRQREVQIIYLRSQSLFQDIVNLTIAPSSDSSTQGIENKKQQNVFLKEDLLSYRKDNFQQPHVNISSEYEKRRSDAIKVLYEDD